MDFPAGGSSRNAQRASRYYLPSLLCGGLFGGLFRLQSSICSVICCARCSFPAERAISSAFSRDRFFMASHTVALGGPLRVLSKEVNASFVVLEFDCDEPSVGPDIIIFSAKRWRHNFRGEKGVTKGICNRQSVVLRLVLISRQYILCGRLKPRESD